MNWQDDVSTVLQRDCAGCHSGAAPAGGYDVGTYGGAIGPGASVPREAVAGDSSSHILTTLAPASATIAHRGLDVDLPLLTRWVVDCGLSYFNSQAHTGGILDPSAKDFHGKVLRDLGWDFGSCATCHGSDLDGPLAPSCRTCHQSGPTSCGTCHDMPPRTGAHLNHSTSGALGKSFDCDTCHFKPAFWDDPGHLFNTDGSVWTGPARVTLSPLANRTNEPAERTGPAVWDEAAASCKNVYCHGGAFADTAASHTEPVWTRPDSGQTDCGACHGLPPSNHATGRCGICHARVADDAHNLLSTELHLDGQIDLGDGSGSCWACHGQDGSPAPPRDLDGHTAPTVMGVGAHQAHLGATHRISAPVECTACHVVPSQPNSPGHLDSDLPAEVSFSGVAVSGGAQPVWNHATASCSGTYCHGRATPKWTEPDPAQVACGTCHGVPPVDGNHKAPMALSDCSRCHPATVNSFGNIIINQAGGVATSTHINGHVEAVPQ